MDDTIITLSPLERKIILLLKYPFNEIIEKSGLDNVSVFHALKYLANKGIIELDVKKSKLIDLGTNGIIYAKNNLPERNLLDLLATKNIIRLEDAKKESRLSDNEFKVALGVLKSKAMIELKEGRIKLIASKEEIVKKTLEEQLIEKLKNKEIYLDELSLEQSSAFNSLIKRKDILKLKEEKNIEFSLTNHGKAIIKNIEKSNQDLIEALTPEIIKSGIWQKKKFRHYDVKSNVPAIYGGKRHFVNEAIDFTKKIWLEMGFKEMQGPILTTSFWNFDALFTPQDHPAREMHDTFFIKETEGKLPERELVLKIKQAHEKGINGSKGWGYEWSEKEAKKILLRTHTTVLSIQTLAKLKELPAKYFAIGKVFRNETIDWKHAFEFYQTEGIVVDKDVNFRHLLGYLQEFYKKMGFLKIKFVPTFFAFTEPSVEIQIFHPKRKEWLELGGA
ncbi:phenylalanine--tRNA ligase subunit alpha [Candidatus Pacearchaeota archaeon]|nr:phenylalanine--tRNA ligase subunit alpha [Candidatus Pacearchaeota archaeon]